MKTGGIVLILGSAPNALTSRDWPRAPFTSIVALNNAWRLRPDWDHLVIPEDFPPDRHPTTLQPHQSLVQADAFVPANNQYGGILYAGGTMAFTAGYWALARLRPSILAFLGCDMVYPAKGPTHFYGQGSADPLRDDVSLRNLEAKSARLMLHAAQQNCACLRLTTPDTDGSSRLIFPSATQETLAQPVIPSVLSGPALAAFTAAKTQENALGYHCPSGRYWLESDSFDLAALDALDALWRDAADQATGITPAE